MPIKSTKLHHEDRQPLITKIDNRLVGRKEPRLSRGRRLTLVNSVLTAMSLYLMPFYLLHVWVRKKLDKIRRNFIWKDRHIARGFFV